MYNETQENINVEVDIREFDGIEKIADYYQILKTELAAGKGADLIVAMGSEIENVYKAMDAGVFADLNPYITSDKEFNIDDYNKAVLDIGVYNGNGNGKRFIIPLEYEVPVIITTQKILNAEEIKLSDLKTFDSFIKTINNYTERYKDNPDKSVFTRNSSYDVIEYSFPWSAITLIDYQAKKTEIDNPDFKTVMDAMSYAYTSEEYYPAFGVSIIVDALKKTGTALHFIYS